MVQPIEMTAEEPTVEGSEDRRDPFERFFADEHVRLARALYLVTGSRSEAEDLAQEAMVRVLERWGQIRSDRVGYLYRTAMNLHRSRLRRLRVHRRRVAGREHPEDPIHDAEVRSDIETLLAGLPEGQREALVLVEWLGMSAEEAAGVLGIQPVSVRVRISRAKASLREGREENL